MCNYVFRSVLSLFVAVNYLFFVFILYRESFDRLVWNS